MPSQVRGTVCLTGATQTLLVGALKKTSQTDDIVHR